MAYVADLDGYSTMCWHRANSHDGTRSAYRHASTHLAINPLRPKSQGRRNATVSASHADRPSSTSMTNEGNLTMTPQNHATRSHFVVFVVVVTRVRACEPGSV